jgi:hypothetical protein
MKFGQNQTAAFIYLDVNLIANGYDGDRPAMKENFKRLGWTPENKALERQMDWIKNTLERYKDSDYIFVAGHYPLGTCPDQESGQMPALKSLLFDYRVSTYFFGHQHTLQFTSQNSTLFVQSGAAGKTEDICENNVGWAVGNTYGYVMVHVHKKSLRIDYMSSKNEVLASYFGASRNKR